MAKQLSGMSFGGSFAPPLTDKELKQFRAAAKKADPPVREAMESLIGMVETFLETPKSKAKGVRHPSGVGQVIPLEAEEVKRIHDVVPWEHELHGLGGHPQGVEGLFDKIPADQKELRDAAFHLLWYAYELTNDREPVTTDMLED